MDIRIVEIQEEHLTTLFTEEERVAKISFYISVGSFIPNLETKKVK